MGTSKGTGTRLCSFEMFFKLEPGILSFHRKRSIYIESQSSSIEITNFLYKLSTAKHKNKTNLFY